MEKLFYKKRDTTDTKNKHLMPPPGNHNYCKYPMVSSFNATMRNRHELLSVPVEGVILHTQVVSRKVAWWISQVVILVPKYTFGTWRRRDNPNTYGQTHGANLLCTAFLHFRMAETTRK